MPSPHLAVRSLAFAPDGTPYALIRRGTELHVARLYDDRIEWIRAVGKAAWWFRIDGGATTGVFADDDHVVPLIAYALGGAGRGRGVTIDGEARFRNWHRVTSTCDGLYAVGGSGDARIYRLEAAGGVDLDRTPSARTAAEREARFFLIAADGVYARRLGDGEPPRWQRLATASFHRCKQAIYDPSSDRVVTVSGTNVVWLIDAAGVIHERGSGGSGLWSVALLGERMFVYDDRRGVVELAADGRAIPCGVDGAIARNQCLFAGGGALYFVTTTGVHRLRGDRWSLVELADQASAVPARSAKPDLPAAPASPPGSDALWERVLATPDAPDDLDSLRVLADALQAAGDPRGELIALQCVADPTPKQARRIAALLALHQRTWLGPLADAASRGSVVFRHGLLRALGLKKAAAARARDLRGCATWATVERLDLAMWSDAAALPVLADPALRALRVVEGLDHIASLRGLGTLPWRALSLHCGIHGNDLEPLCTITNLPALRQLVFHAQDIDQARLDPVWRCPLVQQLDSLQVRCRRLREVVPLWDGPLARLSQLTILPGGTREEPGWELRLRRQASHTYAEVRWHLPRGHEAYEKLAALLRTIPTLTASRLDIVVLAEPPTPAQRAAIESAAATITGEVCWTSL